VENRKDDELSKPDVVEASAHEASLVSIQNNILEERDRPSQPVHKVNPLAVFANFLALISHNTREVGSKDAKTPGTAHDSNNATRVREEGCGCCQEAAKSHAHLHDWLDETELETKSESKTESEKDSHGATKLVQGSSTTTSERHD
jgi:hypothetical protein